MIKLISIVGARPQLIKAATISRALRSHPGVEEILLHTGQHYDEAMSTVFLKELQLPAPCYNLGIHQLGHGAMTGRMLEKIEGVLLKEKPDVVVVYGDTNSTLAGALAAKKLYIPVAHVEAGLRSFNMRMPEEINRILTDRISDFLYCPSQVSLNNLKREGFEQFPCEIVLSGDVTYDAALYYSQPEMIDSKHKSILQNIKSPFVLCTLHREENTNDSSRLVSIVVALNTITDQVQVVLPVHPRTRKILAKHKIPVAFTLLDPVGYFDMLALLNTCSLVMTDSGGLQKEAYFFKKYCITLRNETEWTELVTAGVNSIASSDTSSILNAFRLVCDKPFTYDQQLYGNGHAAEVICSHLVNAIQ